MSDHKVHMDDISHDEGTPLRRQLTTVTLTAEQFESLYLQPRDPRMSESYTRQFGNPTPLYVQQPPSRPLLNIACCPIAD